MGERDGENAAQMEHLAQYVKDGLERQGVEALEEAIDYSRLLLAVRRQERADAEGELGGDRFTVVVGHAEGDSTTKVVKWVTCGDGSCRCAGASTREERHGPYLYHVSWDGNRQVWKKQGSGLYTGEIPE